MAFFFRCVRDHSFWILCRAYCSNAKKRNTNNITSLWLCVLWYGRNLLVYLLGASNIYEWHAENEKRTIQSRNKSNFSMITDSHSQIPILSLYFSISFSMVDNIKKNSRSVYCFIFIKWISNITSIIRSNECEVTIQEIVYPLARLPAPHRIHFADLSYFYCFDCWLLLCGHWAHSMFLCCALLCCVFFRSFFNFLVIWMVLCHTITRHAIQKN